MPQSKTRKSHNAHHQPPSQHGHSKAKKQGRATLVAVIFLATLGLAISFFIAGTSAGAMITGTIVGGIAGYLFGRQIETTAGKK